MDRLRAEKDDTVLLGQRQTCAHIITMLNRERSETEHRAKQATVHSKPIYSA